MKRRLLSFILVLALVISIAPGAFAASSTTKLDSKFISAVKQALPQADEVTGIKGVRINGILLEYDINTLGKPFATLGRTYLPLRAICEEGLKFSVSWEGNYQTATITTPDDVIILTCGEVFGLSGDGSSTQVSVSDTPSLVIVDSRIYVQVRYLSELLNATIDWDADNKIVRIDYAGLKTGTHKIITGLDTSMDFDENGLCNLFQYLFENPEIKVSKGKTRLTITMENPNGGSRQRDKLTLTREVSGSEFTIAGLNYLGSRTQVDVLDALLKDLVSEDSRNQIISEVVKVMYLCADGYDEKYGLSPKAKEYIAANKNIALYFSGVAFTWNETCSGFSLVEED